MFVDNGATYGGAIYANKGTVICRECVFKNNSAVWGASIYGEGDSNVIMSNCLFVQENLATTEISAHAGVMYNCTVDLRNSVVSVEFGGTIWNSIIRGSGVRYDGDIVYPIYYSNVQRLKGGLANIDVDPKFVDAANGDYRLLPSSPCIDSGTYTNAPLTDMDGKPRFVDIPVVGGAGHDNSVDMGCYELQLDQWYTPTPTMILSPTSTPKSTETPYTPTQTPTSTNTPVPHTPTPIPRTPTPTPMLGDLNKDGAVNEKDLLLFLGRWHTGQ
jgi:predicted outer membrane repeat protein